MGHDRKAGGGIGIIAGDSSYAPKARFIDFAHHGGCSQKLSSSRLRDLLRPMVSTWSDAGEAQVGGELTASSVDIVLPMIDDSALFGRIVANHVLSDLYAVGVQPAFALNILGVPDGLFGAEGLSAEEIDGEVHEMLVAAEGALEEAGAVTVGGHTLAVDTLFFGMAATGVAHDRRTIRIQDALPGDRIVLTKPVGTSLTTKAWKLGILKPDDAKDVLDGMLRSNRVASEAMRRLPRCACTDVSGFGLLGHLRNMLEASNVSAEIRVADVPVYPSVRELVDADSATRIFASNRADLVGSVSRGLPEAEELFFMDAQVSGGLLIAMEASEVQGFLAHLEASGEQAWEIGEIQQRSEALIKLD